MPDTMRVLWEGVDGSIWDLLDPFSPVQATELEGLGLPGFTNQFTESAARPGRRYESTTWEANTVRMTVLVADAYVPPGFPARRRDDEWRALDAAWRRSLSPEVTGRLVVITGAGRRHLELRLDGSAPPPPGANPARIGKASYSLTLTADDRPFWRGEPVTETFEYVDASQPFFGGQNGGVLLYVSPSSAMDSAAISNPGDRPVFVDWWARGEFGSLRLGVGDALIPLPFPLSSDQRVLVDSGAETVVDGQGANLWPLMGYSTPVFAPVPPGERVPLRIEMDGAVTGATVGVSLVPEFDGPW